jgi:hypothetical protein
MGGACGDSEKFEQCVYLPSDWHGEPSAGLLAPAFQQSPHHACQSGPPAASGIVPWPHAGQRPSRRAAAAGLTCSWLPTKHMLPSAQCFS